MDGAVNLNAARICCDAANPQRGVPTRAIWAGAAAQRRQDILAKAVERSMTLELMAPLRVLAVEQIAVQSA